MRVIADRNGNGIVALRCILDVKGINVVKALKIGRILLACIADAAKGVALGAVVAGFYLFGRPFTPVIWNAIIERIPPNIATFVDWSGQTTRSLDVAVIAACVLIGILLGGSAVAFMRSLGRGIIHGASGMWAVITFVICTGVSRFDTGELLAVGAIFHTGLQVRRWRYGNISRTYSSEEIARWTATKNETKGSEIDFDNPITTWGQDIVGRRSFVEAVLTRLLIEQEPVVAITGPFGEGKSSAVNLLEIGARQSRRIIVIPFRSWLPGNDSAFAEALFQTADAEIRKTYFIPRLQMHLARYARLIAGTLPSGNWLAQLLSSGIQPVRIQELCDNIRRIPRDVLFLLDEVDRMQPGELLVLLKVIRGLPEIPNLHYVCAFNPEALAKLVSPTNAVYGNEYLEKFFPVQLALPRIDEELRESLFAAGTRELIKKYQPELPPELEKSFNEDFDSLWPQTLKRHLTNIRDLGRVLRPFGVALAVVGAELNPFDLLVIEVVRLLIPVVHEFVYRNAQLFYRPGGGISEWRETGLIDDSERQEARELLYEQLLDNLSADQRQLAIDLLARIFPYVNEYARRKGMRVHFLTRGDSGRERRIYDRDFFRRYFTQTVPGSLFSEKETRDVIQRLNSATSVGGVRRILNETHEAIGNNDLRSADFVERLITHSDDISERQSRWLALAAAGQTENLQRDILGYGEWGRVRRLVLVFASRFQGTLVLEPLLTEIIYSASSHGFAADIAFFCTAHRSGNNIIHNWEGVDEAIVREALGRRMRQAHTIPSYSDFNLTKDDLGAFRFWMTSVPADRDHLVRYLDDQFERSLDNVGKFLSWLFPGNVGYSGDPITFMEMFYPANPVRRQLAAASEVNHVWSAEHQDAIRRFMEFLERRDRGQGGPVGIGFEQGM